MRELKIGDWDLPFKSGDSVFWNDFFVHGDNF